jgi:nucleoside 2-deoxyribosyltransferase
MQTKTIYLCGPIEGRTYEGAVAWRKEFARAMPPHIPCLSPMRGKEYLADLPTMPFTADTLMSNQRAIVERDRYDTMRCDLMVANLLGADRRSIGSMIEFGWADARRIPIVTIMEPGNVHDHPFVRELSGWVVGDLESAIHVVRKILG